ncbi:MAG: hypothetical protein MUE81_12585 [Thermoflexibacter sp.]|nr:hypothetical protein [Thermoflexibacter sp.]
MKKKVTLDTDWLLDFFQLQKTGNPLLNQWTSRKYELEQAQKDLIVNLSNTYDYEGDAWNEEELKVRFLAHIILIANMEIPNKVKTFLERNISANYEDYMISVDVDLMLASVKGLNTPKTPYFFLQELKKDKKSSNDPEAQMIAAMIVAQILNSQQQPIFGGYVVGRFWFFAIIEGKNYSLSHAFDITKTEDLEQVIFCLRAIKEMV